MNLAEMQTGRRNDSESTWDDDIIEIARLRRRDTGEDQ